MRREWGPEDLIACWTLVDDDWALVGNKTAATRLAFAALLKFFELEARFPRHGGEVPRAAVDYLAKQVNVDPSLFDAYAWSGRTIEYHRAQIRAALGFHEPTVEDEGNLAGAGPRREDPRRSPGRLRATVHCTHHWAPVGAGDGTAGAIGPGREQRGCRGGGGGFLAELKADPGQLGLETLLKELEKLERVRALGLPSDLFADASEKLVVAWRARAARLYPSDHRDSPQPIRLTLLAALCWVRTAELTDGLVDLLIALVHKIDTGAERRVEGELIRDLKRVLGKEGILFSLAEAAVANRMRRSAVPYSRSLLRAPFEIWCGKPGRTKPSFDSGFPPS